MKPRARIRLDLELPASWSSPRSFHKSASFRSHLAAAAEHELRSRCDEQWLCDQHVKYLRNEEQERRRRFAQTIANLKGRGTRNQPHEIDPESSHSKKAPVAAKSNLPEPDEQG